MNDPRLAAAAATSWVVGSVISGRGLRETLGLTDQDSVERLFRMAGTGGRACDDRTMKPTELHTLFSAKEQTLLVATEPARLAELSEDELDDLLSLVRRARNKYTKLYRRQSADLVAASSSRRGTSTSNQRTKRKAEIFEDALARVARSLASAASATAKELKRERLDAARVAKGTPEIAQAGSRNSAAASPDGIRRKAKGPNTSPSRQASTNAQGARKQAKRDSR